jgi:hypothetical protein
MNAMLLHHAQVMALWQPTSGDCSTVLPVPVPCTLAWHWRILLDLLFPELIIMVKQ